MTVVCLQVLALRALEHARLGTPNPTQSPNASQSPPGSQPEQEGDIDDVEEGTEDIVAEVRSLHSHVSVSGTWAAPQFDTCKSIISVAPLTPQNQCTIAYAPKDPNAHIHRHVRS